MTIMTKNKRERNEEEKTTKRKKSECKRARHISMHTSCSRNSTSEFMGMCVCMVNEWDVWGLSKLTQTYIASDRFTTLYKAFCLTRSRVRWDTILPNCCICEFVRVLFESVSISKLIYMSERREEKLRSSREWLNLSKVSRLIAIVRLCFSNNNIDVFLLLFLLLQLIFGELLAREHEKKENQRTNKEQVDRR